MGNVLSLLFLGSIACVVLYFRQRKRKVDPSAPFKTRLWVRTARSAPLVGLFLCMTAILFLVQIAASAVITSAHIHKTVALMAAIQTCFVSYEIDSGTASLANDLTGFANSLSRSNPENRTYMKLGNNQKNELGQVIDCWGTPFAMKVLDSEHLQILSAGPDMKWQTADDLSSR